MSALAALVASAAHPTTYVSSEAQLAAVAATLLVDAASRRYAPKTDITGRRRGPDPDVGAYEYPGR